MKDLYQIFALNGFSAPFAADVRNAGTVVDRTGKIAPVMLLQLMSKRDRLEAAEQIADLLNAQAARFHGWREAA
jgi:hypothetical protein